MKRYEYRLVTLYFDHYTGTYTTHPESTAQPLQPGERVMKLMGEPHLAKDGTWSVMAMAERVIPGFQVGSYSPEEMTRILKKGEL